MNNKVKNEISRVNSDKFRQVSEVEAAFNTSETARQVLEAHQQKNIFPLSSFHPYLEPLISEFLKRFRVDAAPAGVAILSTVAATIGNSVIFQESDYTNYARLWILIIGDTSAGKTQTCKFWLKPYIDIYENELEKFNKELQRYNEGTVTKKTKKNKDGNDATQEPENDIVQEKPTRKDLYQTDIFLPTLKKQVLPYTPTVLVFYDEMRAWAEQLRLKTADLTPQWLEMFTGEPYNLTRAGDDNNFFVKNHVVNLLGGTQPIYTEWFYGAKHDFDKVRSGFISRFLFAIDYSDLKTYDNDHKKDFIEERKKLNTDVWQNIINHIWNLRQSPSTITINKEARAMMKEWEFEAKKKANQAFDNKYSLVPTRQEVDKRYTDKIGEQLSRVLLILAVLDAACDSLQSVEISCQQEHLKSLMTREKALETSPQLYEINENQVKRAIAIMEYFKKSNLEAWQQVEKKYGYDNVEPTAMRIAQLRKEGYTGDQILADLIAKKFLQKGTSKSTFDRLLRNYKAKYADLF